MEYTQDSKRGQEERRHYHFHWFQKPPKVSTIPDIVESVDEARPATFYASSQSMCLGIKRPMCCFLFELPPLL